MTRAMRLLILAMLATPALTYAVYRLAKGLGFLDPPLNKEHEYRRAILAAVFAILLFLPILLFGFANAWPRVWALFGVVNALALLAFLGMGGAAALRLWRLRPPGDMPAASDSPRPDDVAGKPLS
jgi:carbon starvation protein CstA